MHLIVSSVNVTKEKYGVCSRFLYFKPKSVKLKISESNFKMPKNP